MSDNIVKFDADVQALADLIDAELVTVLKKLVVEAFNSLTELTPVDTGRARAGWAMTLDSPSEFVPAELTPEERNLWKARKTKERAGLQPIYEKPEMNFEALALINAKQPIFIVNNVEYIGALENGHSAQAPAGMVRITVAALEIGVDSLLGRL